VTVTNDPALRISEFQNEEAWAIQVGAYLKKTEAEEQLAAVGGLHVLAKAQSNVSPLTRNGQTLYRARFEGLSVKDAQSACKALAKLSSGCLIVASN
jgi:cell division protein FtsN